MILGLLFLGIQSVLVFLKPKYFFLLYFLFITSFLGFIPNSIIIGGNEIGLFYQNILMIISYFIHIRRLGDYPKYIRITLNVFILLYLYGVVSPVVSGSSSIIQSVVASKEFSSLFILHFLFINYRTITFSYTHRLISVVGYYLLIVLLLFVILNYIPPYYIKRPGEIQYNYPALLSLFLFLKSSEANTILKKILVVLMLVVWTFGMYFEGHTAILLTTSLACIVVLFRIPLLSFIKNFRKVLLGISILGVGLLFLPIDSYLQELSQTSSFKARNVYNIERIALIKEKPLQGYGFMHKSALTLGSGQYTESLSFIDSGYIDLLGKFGLLGMLVYLTTLTVPFFKGDNDIVIKGLRLFFLQYFLINITWSVFSFTMGLVALGLALYIYYYYLELGGYDLKLEQKKNNMLNCK